MKKLNYLLALASVAAVLSLSAGRLSAQQPPQGQGRGNFDPEQAWQRMMERYKEQLDVKSDDEWKVIEGRIEKVTQARREVGFGGGFGGMAFGRQGRGGGGGGNNAPQGADAQGGRRGGRGGFGFTPSPEAEALQKAIESKAPADELKAKLAKLREARKEKEAALEKAQEDLRKVLSVRQEAAAVLAGLLK
jgi:hypothetical protein